ncbi:MAG TPA: hypothetical protein VLK03_15120, partial [Nocardioides sp.]|nr:hypothetical protein [Nocardioides sp.]
MPPIDDSTRPRVAGSVDLTPRQQLAGDHLRMIHDHFRQQLAQLTTAVTELRDGSGDVGVVRESLHRLAPE